MAKYNEITASEAISTIHLPVHISIKEVEQSLNNQLGTILYEDDDFEDNGGDRLQVKVEKSAGIILSVNGQQVSYMVPMKLWIKKGIGVADVTAEGELEMNFMTAFEITEGWKIRSATTIEGHKWTKSPRLKWGFVNLPVRVIADQVLERSKVSIGQMIDEQVAGSFALDQYVREAWRTLQIPVQLSEEQRMWLKITPQKVTMSPLRIDGDVATSTISIIGISEVLVGREPQLVNFVDLPSFMANEEAVEDVFQINLATSISYREAERLAKLHTVGEEFSQGKYTARIEDIELYGREEKIIVKTSLSGSYNGNLYLEGVPYFNEKTNTIEVRDLNFQLDTRNFLLRSASWLFRRGLERKLADNLRFPLAENLAEIKKMINQQLEDYQITPTVALSGYVSEISVKSTFLTPESILVVFASEGKMEASVRGL